MYIICFTLLCLALFMSACGVEDPIFSPGEDPSISNDLITIHPAVVNGDACLVFDYSGNRDCIDHDGDGYGRFCALGTDCNDNVYYYMPNQGYCDPVDYYFLDPDNDWPAADFALHHDGNTLSTYYIKGPYWPDNPDHGRSFGHEHSSDLIHWSQEDDVLAVNEVADGDWDDDHVWAPSIIEKDGIYYMFYTGVTNAHDPYPANNEQRIGVATSSDLDNWTRYPANNCNDTTGDGCLWDCNFDWTRWGTGSWCNSCRDPFVFQDGAHYYMVYTTSHQDWGEVCGLAKSTDLINWEDLGPIEVTHGSHTESPQVVKVNGYYYLFWTRYSSGGIRYSYSDNIESGDWAAHSLVPNTEGNTHTLSAIACEIMAIDNYYLFAYVHASARVIVYRTMHITEDHNIEIRGIYPWTCTYIDAADINPGAVEIVNGLDDNCNGFIDEPLTGCIDNDGDGYGQYYALDCLHVGTDCKDNDPAMHPGTLEICGDSIDNNCNGYIDEGCTPEEYQINNEEDTTRRDR